MVTTKSLRNSYIYDILTFIQIVHGKEFEPFFFRPVVVVSMRQTSFRCRNKEPCLKMFREAM